MDVCSTTITRPSSPSFWALTGQGDMSIVVSKRKSITGMAATRPHSHRDRGYSTSSFLRSSLLIALHTSMIAALVQGWDSGGRGDLCGGSNGQRLQFSQES